MSKKILEIIMPDLKQELWQQLGEYFYTICGVNMDEPWLRDMAQGITLQNWTEQLNWGEAFIRDQYKKEVRKHEAYHRNQERARNGLVKKRPIDREVNNWELLDIITNKVEVKAEGADAFAEKVTIFMGSPVSKCYIRQINRNNLIYKKRYKFLKIPK